MRRFLRATLKAHGYQIVEAATAREGLAQAAGRNPELILLDLGLLDLGLPDLDGLEVVRTIRRSARTPVIVISARGQEQDKVAARGGSPPIGRANSRTNTAGARTAPTCRRTDGRTGGRADGRADRRWVRGICRQVDSSS